MMEIKSYVLWGALATFVLTFGAVTAFAAGVDGGKNFAHKLTEEQREEVSQAIEDADYSAWYDLVAEYDSESEHLAKITEENFPQFVEAHKLVNEAKEKMDEAKTIFDTLGLESGPRFGMKHMRQGALGEAPDCGFQEKLEEAEGVSS